MPTATLTSKGQITIPAPVRSHLRLKPGDRIEFTIYADGSVSVSPKRTPFEQFSGILRQPGRKPLSMRDMDRAIEKSARTRYRRSRAPAK